MVLQSEAQDKEKILKVEEYAMTFFNTVKDKYTILIAHYEKDKAQIQKK